MPRRRARAPSRPPRGAPARRCRPAQRARSLAGTQPCLRRNTRTFAYHSCASMGVTRSSGTKTGSAGSRRSNARRTRSVAEPPRPLAWLFRSSVTSSRSVRAMRTASSRARHLAGAVVDPKHEATLARSLRDENDDEDRHHRQERRGRRDILGEEPCGERRQRKRRHGGASSIAAVAGRRHGVDDELARRSALVDRGHARSLDHGAPPVSRRIEGRSHPIERAS
jgi:hypothetical protein